MDPEPPPRSLEPRRLKSRAPSQAGSIQRSHGDACLLDVIEGENGVADGLAGLVALSGDQQDVPRTERIDAPEDGLGTIADFAHFGGTHPCAREHFGANEVWVFGPRIVVRYDRDVRMVRIAFNAVTNASGVCA